MNPSPNLAHAPFRALTFCWSPTIGKHLCSDFAGDAFDAHLYLQGVKEVVCPVCATWGRTLQTLLLLRASNNVRMAGSGPSCCTMYGKGLWVSWTANSQSDRILESCGVPVVLAVYQSHHFRSRIWSQSEGIQGNPSSRKASCYVLVKLSTFDSMRPPKEL